MGDMLLLQNEINLMPYLIEKAAGRGMKIALNPSPADEALLKTDLSLIDFIILNEIEGNAFTGKTEPEEICSALLKKYPKLRVVLTLGSRGSVYKDSERLIHQGIYKVKAVDTTAAGDSFTGFFLALIMNGKSPEAALKAAAQASALAVSKMGAAASIPTLGEVAAADLTED